MKVTKAQGLTKTGGWPAHPERTFFYSLSEVAEAFFIGFCYEREATFSPGANLAPKKKSG